VVDKAAASEQRWAREAAAAAALAQGEIATARAEVTAVEQRAAAEVARLKMVHEEEQAGRTPSLTPTRTPTPTRTLTLTRP